MRVIPVAVAICLVAGIIGFQKYSYEKRLSFDYHQVDVLDTKVDHDRVRLFRDRAKQVAMHDKLQDLYTAAQYQSGKQQARSKSRYHKLLRRYQTASKQNRHAENVQKSNLHVARHQLTNDRTKLHRLSLSKH